MAWDRRAEAGGSIWEYIECIRSILRATPSSPASFSGAYYKVTDYAPFLSAPITEFPIYLAGVKRLMIQLAGSHTEGLILGPLNSVAYLKDTVHPNLEKGTWKAQRRDVRIVPRAALRG